MLERRTFLSGLVGLPLVGGGITLIGRPTAAAVPVTHDLMQSYKNWLHCEHQMVSYELACQTALNIDPRSASKIDQLEGC